MKERAAWSLLQEIVHEDLPKLEENLITNDGTKYRVFGRYEISKINSDYNVQKDQRVIGQFGLLRSALSWCIADKYNQLQLAKDIFELDQHRQLARADFRVRVKLYETMSPEKKDLIEHKIENRRNRLIAINNELTHCVGLAKYWQIRGFNNETERLGRPAPNRKNR